MRNLGYSSRQESGPPRVLLTDTARWGAPARLAVGIAKAGIRVSVLCPRRHPVLKARSIAETFHFSSLHPIDSLQAAIEDSAPDIVIPCDDRSVQFLHELYARATLQGRTDIAALISRSLGAPDAFAVV
jgi:hypothetical protein